MFRFFYLRLRNKIRVTGRHQINIAPSAKLRDCRVTVSGEGNQLIIGENVSLRETYIELDGENCTLVIGQGCVIGHGCMLSSRERGTSLIIGERCMLSRNIKIMTSDGHDIYHAGQRINQAKDITVGSRVWLADNVTVLKGVSIGDGSVVGINSTLTKSIPGHSVCVGNPARIIASGTEWDERLTY